MNDFKDILSVLEQCESQADNEQKKISLAIDAIPLIILASNGIFKSHGAVLPATPEAIRESKKIYALARRVVSDLDPNNLEYYPYYVTRFETNLSRIVSNDGEHVALGRPSYSYEENASLMRIKNPPPARYKAPIFLQEALWMEIDESWDVK
ncbi:MAG: hypothetical protein AAFP97_03410 [Pseudomonadota bacterium]